MVRVEHVQLSTYTARILAFSHLHMCNEHVLRLEIAMYKSNRRYLVDMGYGRRYLCQDPHLLRRTRVLPPLLLPRTGPAPDELLQVAVAPLHDEAKVVCWCVQFRCRAQDGGNETLRLSLFFFFFFFHVAVLEELLPKGDNVRVRDFDQFRGFHDPLRCSLRVVNLEILDGKLLRIMMDRVPHLGHLPLHPFLLLVRRKLRVKVVEHLCWQLTPTQQRIW